MATRNFKQEMPPPGGYSPIDYAKKIPKKLNGKKCDMHLLICGVFPIRRNPFRRNPIRRN